MKPRKVIFLAICLLTVAACSVTRSLKDGEYVVFETLYEINEETGDETEVGSHRDLKDASQTVKRRTPPGDRTQTGDNSNALFWIAMAAAAAAVIAVAAALRKSIRAEEK